MFPLLGTVISLGTILGVIILMIIGNLRHSEWTAQDNKLSICNDPADASRFLCDVTYATFETPKGWVPNRSGKNTYAILSRANETYPYLTRMISIDIGKPVEPTTKAVAEAFANKWRKGQVEVLSLQIDGEVAFRVTVPPNNNTMQPVDCVIAMRDGVVFMLIGGAKANGDVSDALDEVVASWKWKK